MPPALTMPLRLSSSGHLHRRLPSSPTRLSHRCCFATSPLHQTPSLLAAAAAIKSRPAKLIPDYLTPTSSHLLATTLSDLLPPAYAAPSTPLVAGPPAALPPGHHLVYFPIQLPPSRLVPDGADPDHAPGPPFHRRMWAGGEVVFRSGARRRLRLDGRPWLCREAVEAVDVRGVEGQEKVFVDVRRKYGLGHEGYQDVDRLDAQEWLIEERRTLVFMRNGDPASPPPPPPRLIKSPYTADVSVPLTPSAIHLFHFSALTFNAHAIHLDRLYARSVDGHRSLLVHGPLTLALMLRVLSAHLGDAAAIASLSYRNHAPLYVDESLTVCLRKSGKGMLGKWDVWVEGPEGGLAVKGTAVVEAVDD
ncbi:hypothetical protein S7711_04047 [Stachybotrys chartarum IBT 7711]|uniref:Uncharacterized protein n=1 Tax=Stachybotrys chartarum (strain CBS 109288 / IBT 7711) TaxID=1280523 RepID=A0A084AXK3_STACB|nr:hypothetical protein S7711_04047 [Stachybotrys chartarum IBT 7711]